jgi:hypothetical protein
MGSEKSVSADQKSAFTPSAIDPIHSHLNTIFFKSVDLRSNPVREIFHGFSGTEISC